MNTIAQDWEDFKGHVMPAGASEVQVREMRRAFYAGVFTHMEFTIKVTEYTEDEGVEFLDKRLEEAREFFEDLTAGRA